MIKIMTKNDLTQKRVRTGKNLVPLNNLEFGVEQYV